MNINELVGLFYHKLNGPDDATAEDAMRVVVRALQDELFPDVMVEPVWDLGDAMAVMDKILGDPEAATAGAIQPQGEVQNGFRRSIEGPEGGAASGAFGLERQGNVPVPGERVEVRSEPPAAEYNSRAGDSRGLPGTHRHEDGGQSVRSVGGVSERPAGRRLGDCSLNEKVAEMPDLPTRTVQLTGITKSERPDIQFEPAPDAAPAGFFSEDPPDWAKDPFNPDVVATCGYCGAWMSVVRPGKHQCDNPNCNTAHAPAAGSDATAVCVWTTQKHKTWSTSCGVTHLCEEPKTCPSCGEPIRFAEAK